MIVGFRKLQYSFFANQYHINIPIKLVDDLEWRKGDEISIIKDGDKIVLVKGSIK